MPPKRATGPKVSTRDPQQKTQKQVKLFSKQVVQDVVKKPAKTQGKQFSQGSKIESSLTNEKDWDYGSGKTPDKLYISSWNVNGIRSVLSKGDLQKYLQNQKPDILCIGETKINYEAFQKEDKIKLDGYHGYWNFCKVSAGYSGVAILSKYLPISVKQDLVQPEHSQEGRVLTMEFEKFYLVTAYIPNSGQKLDRLNYRTQNWDKCFQRYCEQLRKKKFTIICGDLNVCHQEIDIARPKGNEKTAGFTKEERDSFSKFLENGWVDTYRHLYPKQVKYSWWSIRSGGRAKNIGWRLDYFVVNKEGHKYVKDSLINNDIMGSDHCPVELRIDLSAK